MNKEKLAPIVLFVYNRSWHTEQTINALKLNFLAADSDLFIFSDGPKNEEDRNSVEKVREYLKTINGFKSINIIERKENIGLGKSIIIGVTEIINKYGKIIVLEDDIITSRFFLEYLNNGLNLYENDNDVASIHAYVYPTKEKLPETFFLKGADCQGWATWSRAWKLFEENGEILLDQLLQKRLEKEFNFSNSYPYIKMLKNQVAKKNNSWAIRWYASTFLKNKYTLYPGKSLIFNIGFDGSGTNCGKGSYFNKTDNIYDVDINIEKIEVEDNYLARKAFIRYFKKQNNYFLKILRRCIYMLKYEFKIKKNT